MIERQDRYAISSISHFLISFVCFFLFYKISTINILYSIGFLALGISFIFKTISDYLYSKFSNPTEEIRRRFHLYSAIHYAIAGLTLLIFRYFGNIHTAILSILSLIFSYYEYLHSKVPEDEIYRVRRHIMSILFKWYLGSIIFFDALLYNVVDRSLEGILISIIGTFIGIYILFAAIVVYRYIKSTSRIGIIEAMRPVFNK